jgi:hypothetical protein
LIACLTANEIHQGSAGKLQGDRPQDE